MADTTRTPGSTPNEPIAFDERTRRVLELRKQVREGTYRPDPEEIARAILTEWFSVGLDLEDELAAPSVETAAARHETAGRFLVEKSEELSDGSSAALMA